ncbi:hypothetical protein ANO11243_087450 [Dothideomycetidae sp. 11243]|nr:hypothetical protein ANO11243_087450 [fungal sp. No.11243]
MRNAAIIDDESAQFRACSGRTSGFGVGGSLNSSIDRESDTPTSASIAHTLAFSLHFLTPFHSGVWCQKQCSRKGLEMDAWEHFFYGALVGRMRQHFDLLANSSAKSSGLSSNTPYKSSLPSISPTCEISSVTVGGPSLRQRRSAELSLARALLLGGLERKKSPCPTDAHLLFSHSGPFCISLVWHTLISESPRRGNMYLTGRQTSSSYPEPVREFTPTYRHLIGGVDKSEQRLGMPALQRASSMHLLVIILVWTLFLQMTLGARLDNEMSLHPKMDDERWSSTHELIWCKSKAVLCCAD